MDSTKTLATRLRERATNFLGEVYTFKDRGLDEEVADYLDRLPAPDVGVGLTRYDLWVDILAEEIKSDVDPDGEWIRFEDAALLFAAARAASRDVVAAYEEMSRRHLDVAGEAAKTSAALAASTAREQAKDEEIAGLTLAIDRARGCLDVRGGEEEAATILRDAREPWRAALSGRKPDKEGT